VETKSGAFWAEMHHEMKGMLIMVCNEKGTPYHRSVVLAEVQRYSRNEGEMVGVASDGNQGLR
jgi:hypothetical protein